ncbi:MAG TPA: tetratricopeptide repeat protein [Steroidobacteraceae bacterium]|nr:tetratricopeptide repeat protein [Steroidobacteraceae bacterium]
MKWAATLLSCTLLSAAAHAANAPGGWSDLWRTPDQQGQALLDAGQPAQAADRFQDPRRRAYADLEANRYGQAAKLLARFTDVQSEYNLGNALAKSGRLQAALTAYDAALKQAPADRDIRHNRDLVEHALQQQHQSQSSGRNGQRGGKAGSSQGQQPGQSGGRQGSSGSQRPGSGSQSSGSGQTASNGAQAGANSSGRAGRPQAGQSGNPRDSSAQQSAGANPSRAQQAANGSGSSSEAPGQAQRDAAQAAALARARRQQGAAGNTGQAPDTGNLLGGGARTPKQKPETERQLALEQWLRQIPDNAAGLLQRKFLIEHMMRQQDSGDPQGPGGAQ